MLHFIHHAACLCTHNMHCKAHLTYYTLHTTYAMLYIRLCAIYTMYVILGCCTTHNTLQYSIQCVYHSLCTVGYLLRVPCTGHKTLWSRLQWRPSAGPPKLDLHRTQVGPAGAAPGAAPGGRGRRGRAKFCCCCRRRCSCCCCCCYECENVCLLGLC